MKRIFSIFFALIITVFFTIPVIASPNQDEVDISIAPSVSKDSISIESEKAILMGLDNGEILYAKDAHKKAYPASTTKILTALIALENGDLEEIVTIGNEANLCAYDSSRAGIDLNEQISLENLLYGLMLPSGNDAAYSIAVHIGRKVKGDPTLSIDDAVQVFIDLMNDKAKELGATNSHFVTPDGYHHDDHYTTVYDMGLIAREAMKDETFRKLVSTKMYTIPDWSSMHDPEAEETEIRYWRNTNALIQPNDKYYYPDAIGVKTGYTTNARHCLVTAASRDGMELLSVVMGGSKNARWMDSISLMDYGFDNYVPFKPYTKGEQIDILNITNNPETDWVRVIVDETSTHLVHKDKISRVRQEITWDEDIIVDKVDGKDRISIPAPISQYQKVGTLSLILDDRILDEIDLVTSNGVGVKEISEVKFPVKLLDGIESKHLNFLYEYNILQKVGFVTVGLILMILVIRISAVRRRRRRYTFRRRY